MTENKEKNGFIGVSIATDLEKWVRAVAEQENRPVSRQVVEFIKMAKKAIEGENGL